MKAIINKDICIGCSLCASICPDVFRMEGDKAVASVEQIPTQLIGCSDKATDECPVVAITIE